MRLLFLLLFPLAGCSLVTVPVETAGKIVTTTVKTTGSVAEAPFKAVSRHPQPAPPPESH
jgi:hypothetical protein